MSNKNLHLAMKNKKDEFFTMYEDIEKEMCNYTDKLIGKIIYCSCDDYRVSNFYKYFKDNFKNLKLKEIICTCYIEDNGGLGVKYNGLEEKTFFLNSGDFRNEECVDMLKKADVVVTNPPFSLFRDFVDILTVYNKDFIIIGNMNAITYKNVFPLIKNNKIFIGKNSVKNFVSTDGNIKKFGNILWYTTFNIKENTSLVLTENYTSDKFVTYTNYDAINVDKIKDIPKDYYGKIGVPITFLCKYNPKQFEIIGHEHDINGNGGVGLKEGEFKVNDKGKYKRIIIRRIKEGRNEQ